MLLGAAAMTDSPTRVLIVGGGFAGVGCAKTLAKHDDIEVTLVDRNNYHQFQPLLYQVAMSMLAPSDIAYPLRKLARKQGNFEVKLGDVVAMNPQARTVTTADGQTYQGDVLVVAGGSQPNFFHTPGADEHAFPLYSLDDATRLRTRILETFEEADRDAALIDQGALNFAIVGGGPTGVEVAGALAELIKSTMTVEYHDLAVDKAKVHLIDHGHELLAMFAEKAHRYTAGVLERDGVELHFGTGVTEVGPGHVDLSDGSSLRTHCVIWGGGLQAAPVAGATGLPQGKGGRIDVQPDLTVEGFPGVYAVGDIANIPRHDGKTYPQLGSVALQSGEWAGKNILAEARRKKRSTFHYLDKGTMAMIGRGAAVANVHGVELHGKVAFAAWLGVHAALMSGGQSRVDAFVQWAGDYFGKTRGPQLLDRGDEARIDWGDDDGADEPAEIAATTRGGQ
jgi:NADH:ubiquinone reductase (H+-translocating)